MGVLMDMNDPKPRVIEDLDEAVGELLHLLGIAASLQRTDQFGHKIGPMPHQIDGDFFHACWRVLNAQRFEVAKFWVDVLFTVYLPEGNAKSCRRTNSILPGLLE